MKIEVREISSLKPYENNPRINDPAVEAVANSIKEFGFRQPVVVDAEGTIIAGHTRVKAAARLGMTTVPVHVADELTPAQARLYRLADNKTNELAEWDTTKLLAEIQGLDGLESLGFTADELAALDIPNDNTAIDEDAMKDTENECPKCGFKW